MIAALWSVLTFQPLCSRITESQLYAGLRPAGLVGADISSGHYNLQFLSPLITFCADSWKLFCTRFPSPLLKTSYYQLLNQQHVSVTGLDDLNALANPWFVVVRLALLQTAGISRTFCYVIHTMLNKSIFEIHIFIDVFCIHVLLARTFDVSACMFQCKNDLLCDVL